MKGLQAGRMVNKESKWLISWPNGLHAGQTVYKQAEWFTSGLEAYKRAERATVQVDRECKVAKMGYKKGEVQLCSLPRRKLLQQRTVAVGICGWHG